MAARNKPAGIRYLVYGMGKGKGCIEGLSVSVALRDRILEPPGSEARVGHVVSRSHFGHKLNSNNAKDSAGKHPPQRRRN